MLILMIVHLYYNLISISLNRLWLVIIVMHTYYNNLEKIAFYKITNCNLANFVNTEILHY